MSAMKVVIMDGQGGGIGRMLVQKLKARAPGLALVAVGTNAMATSAMLRAGADAGATGENAVLYNCADADVLLGPSGIAIANAMLGEISPAMARAVAESPAKRLLLSMDACGPGKTPGRVRSMDGAASELVREALAYMKQIPNP